MLSERIVLHLSVPYYTRWGQRLVVIGAGALFGNWDTSKGHDMSCYHVEDQLIWEAKLEVPLMPQYNYSFAVIDESGNKEPLEFLQQSISLPQGLASGDIVSVFHEWQDTSNPSHLLSRGAFSKVILSSHSSSNITAKPPLSLEPSAGEVVVRLQVRDWSLHNGERMVVTGSLPQMDTLLPRVSTPMTQIGKAVWQTEFQVPANASPINYKYAVESKDGELRVESGDLREVDLGQPNGNKQSVMVVRCDGYFRHERQWRGAAAACPVFALRTNHSLGVGDFLDIKNFVDLCDAAGMRMIQLLPVNDTSVHGNWWDSYPYSSLSVFALHPIYLSVDAITGNIPRDVQCMIDEARAQLEGPQPRDMDYEGVMAAKKRIVSALFDVFGAETLESKEFKEWAEANSEWLRPYALFCFLRDFFGTAQHWRWGTFSQPTPEAMERLLRPDQPHARIIQLTFYVQWHLHCQLLEVSRYAATHRVALKGDLPIGVDKCSVDTWMEPSLFRMNFSTGAPPDYFDKNGQNWGFPTYNWEEMAKDNYAWWRRRLANMSQYFHALRIDHILGFFRIWEIPANCTTGLLGHFRPALPITRQELEAAGIWDIDRLCEPYVTRSGLEEQFGPELAGEVASKYLSETAHGRYEFRPQFASEKAIASIQAREGSPQWLADELQRVRQGLLKLRQNVLLLRNSSEPHHFYPRIQLMDTGSWRALDAGWRDALAGMHDNHFYRAQDALWRAHALKTLPVLMGATDMLVCGEDLGMIPGCVHPVMQELGLLGLRIQRMPSEPGQEFGNPAAYPYMTVASPSCHDTSTTRAWYEEDAERRERFFYKALDGVGEPPACCSAAIVRTIVRQHLDSPSIWAIFPIQDLMALSPTYLTRPATEETINNPTVRRHYWRYRMHVTLEQLAADVNLIADVQALLLASERCSVEDLPELLTQ